LGRLYYRSHSDHFARTVGRSTCERAGHFNRREPRVRLCRGCHRGTAPSGRRRSVYGDGYPHARSRWSDSRGRNNANRSCTIRRSSGAGRDEHAGHAYRDGGSSGPVPASTWDVWPA